MNDRRASISRLGSLGSFDRPLTCVGGSGESSAVIETTLGRRISTSPSGRLVEDGPSPPLCDLEKILVDRLGHFVS